MKKIGKNVIANIITKLWALISIYVFIPFYIQILGEESYGIVSFFATMQSAINILGLGLANTLRREFAVKTGDDENDNLRRKKLLRCIEIVYVAIAIGISIVCCLGSNIIASKWLNLGTLDISYVASTVALMGISIAIQIVANLYSGCLFGLDLQGAANLFQIIWSMLKYCGSLFIIAYIAVDLRAFYFWHVMMDILYLLVMRIYLGKKLATRIKYRWSISDFHVITDIWNYAAGIFVISIVALVNKQLDKIIISKMLSLTELGGYNLATTLGNLTTVFATAMYISVFPGFTRDITAGNKEAVQKRFLEINRLVNVVTSCMFCFVAIFSIPLVQFWTGTDSYNEMLTIAAPLVIIAIGITEFQEIPYALALANGNTKINATLGIVYLPLVCVCTWIGISNFGLIGAGLVYLIMMGSQTFVYEYIIYKKYLCVNPFLLIIKDTVIPIGLSCVFALASFFVARCITNNNKMTVFFAVAFGGISMMLEMLLFNKEIIKRFIAKEK